MPHRMEAYSFRVRWLSYEDCIAAAHSHKYHLNSTIKSGPTLEWIRLDASGARAVVNRAPTRTVLQNGERWQEYKLVFIKFESVEVPSDSEAVEELVMEGVP